MFCLCSVPTDDIVALQRNHIVLNAAFKPRLRTTLPRTNYYRKSFSYSGATLWNSLPCDIRNTESLGLFKRKINATL